MAFGGKGVARVDGKVFFVTDAVPGDVVDVEIVEAGSLAPLTNVGRSDKAKRLLDLRKA